MLSGGVSNIGHHGHLIAMSTAAASLSPASRLSEELNGLSQLTFLKEVAKKPDLQETVSILQTLAAKTLHTVNFKASCNLREERVDGTLQALSAFLSSIPGDRTDSEMELETESFVPQRRRKYIKFPFQVHYVARAVRTVPFTHPAQPSLVLLARLMTNKVSVPSDGSRRLLCGMCLCLGATPGDTRERRRVWRRGLAERRHVQVLLLQRPALPTNAGCVQEGCRLGAGWEALGAGPSGG